MGSIAIIYQHNILFPVDQIRQVLQEKQGHPLHHGQVANSLKVSNPKKDKYHLQILLQILLSIKFSFQWYMIRQVLREKQICPLCHGHVMLSLKVNNPKMDKTHLQVLQQKLISTKLPFHRHQIYKFCEQKFFTHDVRTT